MAIRELDSHLINQIAAGEVVERPASALKELIENALDADARHIDIWLSHGGIAEITVEDDGAGISEADLPLAVQRHATSKLPTGDLSNIFTLGFRGEALASIGAVADLLVESRARDPDPGQGVAVEVRAGQISGLRPAARARGTRIQVRGLFDRVPARQKFLKSERAEFQACKETVVRLALAYPAVGFRLWHNGKKVLDVAGAETAPETRLGQLLDKDFEHNAVPVDARRHETRLSGWAVLPAAHRATAGTQFLYVNSRPVRDRLLAGALRAAYGDLLPRGRHPACLLFLELPPQMVDVNVHPAKTEVRFREAADIRSLLVTGVRQSLEARENRQSLHVGAERVGEADNIRAAVGAEKSPVSYQPLHRPGQGMGERLEQFFRPYEDWTPAARHDASPGPVHELAESEGAETDYFLGAAKAQVMGTYIVAESRNGLVVIDQHAAHERLVYEELKSKRAALGRVPGQGLLTPEIVELRPEEAEALLELSPVLADWGLDLDSFSQGAVMVRSIPQPLADVAADALVRDLAQLALDEGGAAHEALENRLDAFLADQACRHSVRAGRRLNTEEMNQLLRQMEEVSRSGQCNHGRPSFITLHKEEIEKLFHRR